jgi:hypothetical protein
MLPEVGAGGGILFCFVLVQATQKNMLMSFGYYMIQWILFGTCQLNKIDISFDFI